MAPVRNCNIALVGTKVCDMERMLPVTHSCHVSAWQDLCVTVDESAQATSRSVSASPRRPGYRPALDGMRAVAVIAVFVFHARPSWLPGGWLGVDLFFVISGFLITRLLLAEHHTWGWISLSSFWTARARRLLPAAVLVVGAVLVATWFWAPVGRRNSISGDALATLAYVANWRLIFSDEAYFAAVANPSPLRHAWSLAVEEQYYILFPLLLILLLQVPGRRLLPVVLLTLASVSAWWMAHLHVPGLDPSRVYYGTDARVHELLVGAAAGAILAPGSTLPAHGRLLLDRWARRLALPFLAGVVCTFFVISEDAPWVFEGGLVAFSLAAVVIVIAAASPNESRGARLLSLAPLRTLGVISYGVYLWHWPVIVFLTSARLGVRGVPLVLLQAAATLALAGLSYRFVENPIRRGGWKSLTSRRPALSKPILVVSLASVVGLALVMPKLPTPLANATEGGVDWSAPAYEPGPDTRSVLLVGNSIPYSLYVGFNPGSYPDLNVMQNTNFGCDPIEAPKVVNGAVAAVDPACITWRDSWPATISSVQPDLTVVFLTHPMLNDHVVDGATLVAGSPAHDDFLEQAWGTIHDRALESGSSNVAFVNLACHRLADLGASDEVTRTNDDKAVTHLNNLARAWGAASDVAVIDQFAFLCAGGYEDAINGVPLYVDGLHFSEDSAREYWTWLAPQLQALATKDAP